MIVYEVKTGKPHECEPVDARELIASGVYTGKQEEEKQKRCRPSNKAEEE